MILFFSPIHYKTCIYNSTGDSTSFTKASYIYNFSKLIDWPTSQKHGVFVIAILSSDETHHQIDSLLHLKKIGDQHIEVIRISELSPIRPCHILFVDHEFGNCISGLSEKIKNYNTLLIGCDKHALENGASINLLEIDNHLRFELNLVKAERHGLFVGTTLRGLAHNLSNSK